MRLLGVIPLVLLAVLLTDLVGIYTFGSGEPGCEPDGTILVMGAAQYDGEPSPAFRRRLDEAWSLFEAGCAGRVVVSGGRRDGDRYSEGETGVIYLAGRGIPPEALKSEEHAVNSYQNLQNSLPLVDGDLLLVTDDLHAYRSSWLARHFRLQASVATVRAGGPRLSYALRELVVITSYRLGFFR